MEYGWSAISSSGVSRFRYYWRFNLGDDAVFDSFLEMENNEDREPHMSGNVIFDRFLNEDEVEIAKVSFFHHLTRPLPIIHPMVFP